MSGSITKKHMEDAAERIRKMQEGPRRDAIINFLCAWFAKWNSGFDAERFTDACSGIKLRDRKSGDLTKAIRKIKSTSEFTGRARLKAFIARSKR